MIRWLGLILLLLSIRPQGFENVTSSGHESSHAEARSVATWGVERHAPPDWSVDAYDDDDQDDSAPAAPGPAPGGSDDDFLCSTNELRVHAGAFKLLPRRLTEGGLGPARGHSRDTEHPPEST